MPGEVAEWSIAAVLKTVELRGSGGSNPSLSAKSKRSKKVSRNSIPFVFYAYGISLIIDVGMRNKMVDLSTSCEMSLCRGPCGEQ